MDTLEEVVDGLLLLLLQVGKLSVHFRFQARQPFSLKSPREHLLSVIGSSVPQYGYFFRHDFSRACCGRSQIYLYHGVRLLFHLVVGRRRGRRAATRATGKVPVCLRRACE